MIGTDYTGISILVTALTGAFTSILVAVRQGGIRRVVCDTHEQVKTSNGHTLGEIAEQVEQRTRPDDA